MQLALIVGTPDLRRASSQVILGSPDLESNLRRAARWGYDGVELGLRDPAALDSRRIRSWLQEYQLGLAAFCTGEVFGQDGLGLAGLSPEISLAAEARFRAIIDLAAEFDGGRVVTIGRARGRLNPEKPQESWDDMAAVFRRLADYAAPRGVRLALEPCNHYEANSIITTQDGVAMARAVDRPNFGLMLDVYHMNIEDQNVYASLRQARPYCWHVHMADNNRKWPGNAHIDFASIVATLADLGYTGYLSAECAPWPDPDTAGAETIRYMRRWVPRQPA
jgi:sugar phosphate isomerase/epimerase